MCIKRLWMSEYRHVHGFSNKKNKILYKTREWSPKCRDREGISHWSPGNSKHKALGWERSWERTAERRLPWLGRKWRLRGLQFMWKAMLWAEESDNAAKPGHWQLRPRGVNGEVTSAQSISATVSEQTVANNRCRQRQKYSYSRRTTGGLQLESERDILAVRM